MNLANERIYSQWQTEDEKKAHLIAKDGDCITLNFEDPELGRYTYFVDGTLRKFPKETHGHLFLAKRLRVGPKPKQAKPTKPPAPETNDVILTGRMAYFDGLFGGSLEDSDLECLDRFLRSGENLSKNQKNILCEITIMMVAAIESNGQMMRRIKRLCKRLKK